MALLSFTDGSNLSVVLPITNLPEAAREMDILINTVEA
jgi:hypothetical protein